jgi:hypothetical protein
VCPSARSSAIGVVEGGATVGRLGEVVAGACLSFLQGATRTVQGWKSWPVLESKKKMINTDL